MTELFEKSIRVLELPQLLERLSQKAVSEAAKERALRLTPSTDADDVRRLQDETDAARALIGLRGSPSFSGVKDVREALARAERGGMLNPRELLTIAGLLTNSRRVREYYEADQGEGTVLDRMFDSLHANRFLEDKITTSILSEDEIADAASPELADIRRHKRAASAKGRQILQKIISSPSYKSTLQEALITQRDGRFVVPVKADHRGDLPGLVHDISASGATLFVEPMGVVQANNELKELEAKEKKEIERILFALSAEAAGFAEAILWDYDILVHLDLIFARGELSYQMDAARPEIRTDGSVSLRRARHPLLDPAKAVPIDIEVGRSFDTLVITGPNTGGKTVSLKPQRGERLYRHPRRHRRRAEHRAEPFHLLRAHEDHCQYPRRGGRRFPRPLRRAGRGHRPGRGRGPRHRGHRARPRPRREGRRHHALRRAQDLCHDHGGRRERELRVRRGDALPHL